MLSTESKRNFIKRVILGDLSLIDAQKLAFDENIELTNLTINDFLIFNEEIILEIPTNDANKRHCSNLIINHKTLKLKNLSDSYELNISTTFKQIVSYYIKYYKFKID